jgi:hypothetical protein
MRFMFFNDSHVVELDNLFVLIYSELLKINRFHFSASKMSKIYLKR